MNYLETLKRDKEAREANDRDNIRFKQIILDVESLFAQNKYEILSEIETIINDYKESLKNEK